jgi:hypothetical protein
MSRNGEFANNMFYAMRGNGYDKVSAGNLFGTLTLEAMPKTYLRHARKYAHSI